MRNRHSHDRRNARGFRSMRHSSGAHARSPRDRLAAAGILLALAVLPASSALAGSTPGAPTVALPEGEVEGRLRDGVHEFLGIPFAAPPVGELRWRPPAPAGPWTGTLEATTFGPACPQSGGGATGTASEEEDCLYLNVWAPVEQGGEPAPVMVWIHGGGNTSGSTGGNIPYPPYEANLHYDGATLAREHGVVVVSVAYRLGVFGFFGHDDLAGEDAAWPFAGNQGLLDQVAALEWVRDRIDAFGGDPSRVTVFGESAGAWNTCAHVASPRSAGLFHRAISQSGGCSVGVLDATTSDARARAVSATVGCDGAPDELACLRATPVADLLAEASAGVPEGVVGAGLGISIDGGFLPAHPRDILDAGDFARVPWILGANTDEASIFLIGSTPLATDEEYTALIFDRFGDFADEVLALYPASGFASPQKALERMLGDSTLLCSTYDTARRAARAKNRTWVYHFARVLPLSFVSLLDLGVFHGSEIGYVFGSLDPAPTSADASLGQRMRGYWTGFAARGKPKAKGSTGWPRFQEKSWSMLRINVPEPTKLRGFRKANCDFWTSFYEATGS